MWVIPPLVREVGLRMKTARLSLYVLVVLVSHPDAGGTTIRDERGRQASGTLLPA